MGHPMSVVEFIQRKNQIIFDDLGVTLVPEDQIEECTKHKLFLDINPTSACPYCAVYYYNPEEDDEDSDDPDLWCPHCPMAKAGNVCGIHADDTFTTFTDSLGVTTVMEYYKSSSKIAKLYEEYNKQFK